MSDELEMVRQRIKLSFNWLLGLSRHVRRRIRRRDLMCRPPAAGADFESHHENAFRG